MRSNRSAQLRFGKPPKRYLNKVATFCAWTRTIGGILQRDALRHLFELPSKEKENYLKDFTHQMAARGLHID